MNTWRLVGRLAVAISGWIGPIWSFFWWPPSDYQRPSQHLLCPYLRDFQSDALGGHTNHPKKVLQVTLTHRTLALGQVELR